MSRIVHFEVQADDPARVAAFYKKAFGWDVQKWDGPMEYWTVMTGPDNEPGINGGLSRRDGSTSSTVNTIGVQSLDDTVEAVLANGGEVVMPRSEIPGVGFLAYVKDTEGNVFGLMESL